MRLQLEQVSAGRLPMSQDMFEKILRENTSDQNSQTIQSLTAVFHGEPFDPAFVIPGDKSRTTRLTSFDYLPNDEGIRLDTRIEPSKPPKP